MEERLQKLLSAAGVCSRRAAETYIADGRVTVNGQPAELGQRADPERDDIQVDGKPLAPRAEHVYLLLNKPRGYVTTLADERGRKTVAELVKDCGQRVYPVGRLDLDSEGLLLMTNDGELMQHLLKAFQVAADEAQALPSTEKPPTLCSPSICTCTMLPETAIYGLSFSTVFTSVGKILTCGPLLNPYLLDDVK